MSTASIQTDPQSNDADALRGRFVQWLKPKERESDYVIDEIQGEVPRELRGTLYRNGPNQKQAPSGGFESLHLFDGDAMVHAFRFDEGKVSHKSRWIRTESFEAE
jgi:carotenoid cleavage dioxygenase-like enzyme